MNSKAGLAAAKQLVNHLLQPVKAFFAGQRGKARFNQEGMIITKVYARKFQGQAF